MDYTQIATFFLENPQAIKWSELDWYQVAELDRAVQQYRQSQVQNSINFGLAAQKQVLLKRGPR